MTTDLQKLGELALWQQWQDNVKKALPNFAANNVYVEQCSPTPEDYERVAAQVKLRGAIDTDGQLRDTEFGAYVVRTPSLGDVTRMWLEANVEIRFMQDNGVHLSECDVLDIGAGYGRLEPLLAPLCKSLSCVDAVPISTELCKTYCARFAPLATVYSLSDFKQFAPDVHFDVAINVHSWNECPFDEVKRWLAFIRDSDIKWLFTVVHGRPGEANPYYTWTGKRDSFRPLIERDFMLVREKRDGLNLQPHALWMRR